MTGHSANCIFSYSYQILRNFSFKKPKMQTKQNCFKTFIHVPVATDEVPLETLDIDEVKSPYDVICAILDFLRF